MYITIVDVLVKAKNIADFVEATRLNHLASVQEPGNRQFDVLQPDKSSQQFVLYEAFASEEDAREHKKTTHYLNWRETVADWVECPRSGLTYTGLF